MQKSNKEFSRRVVYLVAQIPKGRVMTYGQLAALAGNPQAARIVGGIAHFGDSKLPWQRVVNKQGRLASGYPGGRRAHAEHLKAEGVEVTEIDGDFKVDVEKLIWWPEQAELAIEDGGLNIRKNVDSPTPNPQPPILFIVGPTASGKSKLAMDTAIKYKGEIICADSQTIRRGLDIGTAKPSEDDQKVVPHHLLDVIEPYDRFSVAEFKSLASEAINDILRRGKLPIIVGGTGLYIDALLYNFPFRKSSSSLSRDELEKMNVEQLQSLVVSQGLELPNNSHNPRHLIRTIESQGLASQRDEIRAGAVVIGLDPGKEMLEKRIEKRIQKMIADGFLKELDRVLEKYGNPTNSLDAIGYKIALTHKDSTGMYDVEQLIKDFETADRQYAKKQRSWFKRNKDIKWFEQQSQAEKYIAKQI